MSPGACALIDPSAAAEHHHSVCRRDRLRIVADADDGGTPVRFCLQDGAGTVATLGVEPGGRFVE
ncbi:hypothetical protein [Arthrobacter ulcerisalmonis]|uniref:hypothetical protein n=1 Tax=Arthrobacter ulcerisalmonis TaxID=2483813 RepID=UPI00366E60FD